MDRDTRTITTILAKQAADLMSVFWLGLAFGGGIGASLMFIVMQAR